MIVIGLTGGIGSGKSTVGKILASKGFSIYNSDKRAKAIMNENTIIVKTLKEWYGETIYKGNLLNRKLLGNFVFKNKDELQRLNKLVHPQVFLDFEQWKTQHHTAKFVVKEAAILFESGSYLDCDEVVTVSALEEIRISRVMSRDNLSKELIVDRIQQQWTDAQREKKADYVIDNNSDLGKLEESVNQFIEYLYQKY